MTAISTLYKFNMGRAIACATHIHSVSLNECEILTENEFGGVEKQWLKNEIRCPLQKLWHGC